MSDADATGRNAGSSPVLDGPTTGAAPRADELQGDFAPTASLQMLRRRAELLTFVRRFFDDAGYWEVETPLLSGDVLVDAHLDPFVTEDADGRTLYLQTSPEFGMKRLLAAGAEAIYQLTRAFRRGERGRLHNPEFTMLEWYRTGDTHREQMDFTERLVRAVFRRFAPDDSETAETRGSPPAGLRGPACDVPFERMSYEQAFRRFLGTGVLTRTCEELQRLAESRGLRASERFGSADRDVWLNLLLTEFVEPHLGRQRPTFVFDYPASQAALAKVRPDDPPVAERFELYVRGVEICNGYHELTDADELRRRGEEQSSVRLREGLRPLPLQSRLLQAMQAGLPACSGVALGIDRLAATAFGVAELSLVQAFPIDRA